MKVKFEPITEADRKEYKDINTLNNRTKLIVIDDDGHKGFTFIENSEIELFGKDYISLHVSLQYSKPLEDWFVVFNRDEFFNDLTRNPLRPIRVEFVEIENGTGREVYRGVINKRYYLRENHRDENVAVWAVCGKRRQVDDGDMPRANILFEHGKQLELVTYHDGVVAAWDINYNKDFSSSMVASKKRRDA